MTRHNRTQTHNREAGQAGAEILVFGFVLLVGVILLVANTWAVIDAKLSVSAASREATRALVESDSGSPDAAVQAATDVMTGLGRSTSGDVSVDLDSFERCARVRVRVISTVPAIALPRIGGLRHAFVVRSTHSEIVDPFRSGLEGDAICAP